jgi:hypothetical protein
LIPPPDNNADKEKPFFAISALKNKFDPDGVVPEILGKHRYAPPLAAMSYSEIVGDLQYIRALFMWGYGPLAIPEDSLKIGDTEFSKYDEIEYELRLGYPDDAPVTLYPQQVIEESTGVEMRLDKDRDDNGKIIDDSVPEEKPVSRFTATSATEAAIIFGFPNGLCHVSDEGDVKSQGVRFRIRQRLVTSEDWQTVEAGLVITNSRRESFYRQYRWVLPERGQYEIEVTRLTINSSRTNVSDRTMLVAVQSYRPEYPINFDKPVALLAMRIKATYQLNGSLDGVNGMPSRICPDWDADTETWITRETQNPASLYRYALQSPSNAFPLADSEIDLDALADWHEFCVDKGLNYNRVHDFDGPLGDGLLAICAAGRASPRHDGLKATVVVDRPQEIVVDHIGPRNSRNFAWSRIYPKFPDAFRVRFIDETNNYQEGERIVPLPNFAGTIDEVDLAEDLPLPGITDPTQIYKAARRRAYELIYRPDRFTFTQDGAATVATRGDLVMGSYDVLSSTQTTARVVAMRGNLVELDDFVTMAADQSYAIRFQTGITEEDTVGAGAFRAVATEAGRTKAIRLTGSGPIPRGMEFGDDGKSIWDGDFVQFGPAETVSLPLVVRETRGGDRMSTDFSAVAAATIIDELLDAEEVPVWDGRVGEIVPITITLTDDDGIPLVDDDGIRLVSDEGPKPSVPTVSGIETGDGLFTVMLQPGSFSVSVGHYEVDHRLLGDTVWSTASGNSAAGAVDVSGYEIGDQVELRPRAVSFAGEPSLDGAVSTWRVGSDLTFIPEIASFDAVRQTSGLWRYSWTTTPLADWQTASTLAGWEIRAKAGAWGDWDDLEPIHTGLLTGSPWDVSSPLDDGFYTFGLRGFDLEGNAGDPFLIYATSPASTAAMLTDDDGAILADDDSNIIQEDA